MDALRVDADNVKVTTVVGILYKNENNCKSLIKLTYYQNTKSQYKWRDRIHYITDQNSEMRGKSYPTCPSTYVFTASSKKFSLT